MPAFSFSGKMLRLNDDNTVCQEVWAGSAYVGETGQTRRESKVRMLRGFDLHFVS